MNRFFGKTSQKLCVAGFVVCAGLAPIFQLEAVQDFMLNNVAPLLIKRPLVNPEFWRICVKAFSSLLFIAALLVFGFLYSLATSARLAGYLRGAAQDLKDFFHNKDVFNRRNGRILLAIFAISFAGYFALIRSGVSYIDDIGRQSSGSFGWAFGFGRVVTEALNLAIHGAYLIHDRSPLGQVIAMGFLSAAALVMALVFSDLQQRGGVAKLGWLHVAASMIVVFNPYFLGCIAFKYDSPGMAISVLLPLVPFLFMGMARLYTVGSFFCVLGMYLSYQASSGIYVMMVIFIALLKYITEEWTLGEATKFCARSAALFVVASALFYLAGARFLSPNSYRSTSVSIGLNVPKNVALYLVRSLFDFNAAWIALSLLVAGSAAFAVCRLSKKKLVATLALFLLALVLALVLSQGGFIFLVDYASGPRYKYGLGMLLAILASVSVLGLSSLGSSCKRALAAAPAVLLAWSFFSYASAFGNAQANQMKMELQYEALLREDLNALFPQEEYPQLEIGFIGGMPWSGEVKNLVKAYPITESLLFKRHQDQQKLNNYVNGWAGITMRYFDPTLKLINKDNPPAPIEEMVLLLERRYYNIYLEDSGRVIVECRMGEQLSAASYQLPALGWSKEWSASSCQLPATSFRVKQGASAHEGGELFDCARGGSRSEFTA